MPVHRLRQNYSRGAGCRQRDADRAGGVSMNNPAEKTGDYQYIGTRSIRPDGVDKVTGRALYIADISVDEMWHGVTIRSQVPHGILRRIRFDPALRE